MSPDPPPAPGRRADSDRGRWPQRLAPLAIALLALGPLAAHFELLPPLAGFGVFVFGGVFGFGVAVAGLVAALRGGTVKGMRAFFLGLLPAAVLAWSAFSSGSYPPINDISTDLAKPPEFVRARELPGNRGRDLSYPEAFKDVVAAAYPDLRPRNLAEAPERVFERALFLARTRPNWEITRVDRDALTFEGVATTWLFRFRDDFVVRVSPSGDGAAVDMRSKSRAGRGDVGANAARIREFFALLG